MEVKEEIRNVVQTAASAGFDMNRAIDGDIIMRPILKRLLLQWKTL